MSYCLQSLGCLLESHAKNGHDSTTFINRFEFSSICIHHVIAKTLLENVRICSLAHADCKEGMKKATRKKRDR